MQRRNLAARAGRWSARHRRVAILGWLGAFVVAIFLIGAVGLNTLKPQDQGVGESRRADRLQASAGLLDPPTAQVVVPAPDPPTKGSTPIAHSCGERRP